MSIYTHPISGPCSGIVRGQNELRVTSHDQNNIDNADYDGDDDNIDAASGDKEKVKVRQQVNEEEILSEIVIQINDDIENFSSSNQNKSNKAHSKSSLSRIYRVPSDWCKVHETAFIPTFVSIGPLNRKNNRDNYVHGVGGDMENKLKTRFLSDLLGGSAVEPSTSTSTGVANYNPTVERLAFEIKELEVQARSYYAETFDDIDSKQFVLMMIRDGCFVIQLLRLFANSYKQQAVVHPIFSTRWLVPNLRRDLLLFENQLPWIVLEKVFEISGLDKEGLSLIDLALKFCNPLMPREKKILDKCKFDRKPDHLLGLFRASFLSHFKIQIHLQEDIKSASPRASLFSNFKKQKPGRQYSKEDNKSALLTDEVDEEQPQLELEIYESERPRVQEDPQFIHSVTELEESGVSFKKRKNHDLLDISFRNGVLEMPPLLIDDQTGHVLLNFLACEQCDGRLKPYFTNYVTFIDNLVNSAKDVEILHYKGIISHSLGSDEQVAELFNKLCKELVREVDDSNYLYSELKEINTYCGRKLNRWRAELTHNYFSSPWTLISVIAAIFLLILTILQTIFTILPFALS